MKTKSLIIFIIFICTIFHFDMMGQVWNGEKEKYSKGIGTSKDPFIIEKPSNLAFLADGGTYKGKYFLVTEDLDLGGLPWTPIASFQDSPFQGSIDFGNHTIKNLYVDRTERGAGLFGYLKDGSLSNLTIDSSCEIYGETQAGILAAYAENVSVSKLKIYGKVTTNGFSPKIGGLFGTGINVTCSQILNFASVIHESENQSSSDPILNVGGIIGYCENTNIDQCANYGYISGYDPQPLAIGEVGGIIGSANNTKVSFCFNQGDVYCVLRYVRFGNDGTKSYVAGIVGGRNGAEISSCYNVGHIQGQSYWGGKYACIMSCDDWSVNDNYKPLIECYSTWDITGCQALSYTCEKVEFNGIKSSIDEINSSYIINKMNVGTNFYVKDEYPFINNGLPFFYSIEAIKVITELADEISATSVKLNGAAMYTGMLLKNFKFRIKPKMSQEWIEYSSLSKSLVINDLMPGTTYTFQFGVQSEDGREFWSDTSKEFTTRPIYSEAFTISVENISHNHATFKGAVVLDNNEELIQYGFKYKSVNSNELSIMSNNKIDEYYSSEIFDLSPNSQYQVRAYAETNLGTVYGDIIVFTTSESGILQIQSDKGTFIELYDCNGFLIYKGNQISLEDLQSGIYIVRKQGVSYKVIR